MEDYTIEEAIRHYYNCDINLNTILEISKILNLDLTQTFNMIFQFHKTRPDKLELHYQVICSKCKKLISEHLDFLDVNLNSTTNCYTCGEFKIDKENVLIVFKVSNLWKNAIRKFEKL